MSNKNKTASNQNIPEKTIDTIRWTIVKDYGSLKSFMRIAVPFSITLTNKAIYSYLFGVIPIGNISLQDIISFKIVKNATVGLAYFRQGIVIKYQKENKIKEVFFFVSKNKIRSFADNLNHLGLKEVST
ncbi:hypothetical protein J4437_07965 [Candidatus Woesearchaeota archaeon]|nr:hypothetical protein [Candidatus Woesearchaeota archaeon]